MKKSYRKLVYKFRKIRREREKKTRAAVKRLLKEETK